MTFAIRLVAALRGCSPAGFGSPQSDVQALHRYYNQQYSSFVLKLLAGWTAFWTDFSAGGAANGKLKLVVVYAVGVTPKGKVYYDDLSLTAQ